MQESHYSEDCLCKSCKSAGNRKYIGGGVYNINDNMQENKNNIIHKKPVKGCPMCEENKWEEEIRKIIDYYDEHEAEGGNGQIVFEISQAIHSLLEQMADEMIEIAQTHTEKEGGYCDTGEDMEWACRSECVELAIKRLIEIKKKYIKH